MQRSLAIALLSLACARLAPPASAGPPTLLEIVGEWQYPGSELRGAQASDGATLDGNGDRTAPSIACKVTMTTDAPVGKVLEYYRAKLSPKPKAGGGAALAGSPGRSVVFGDDSAGRPFALHTVMVNEMDASTTLVITRGEGEAKTHIAWKHYRRFRQ